MTDEVYCAEAYRIGYDFARRLLAAGKDSHSVRRARERAQERLRSLRAHSACLDHMKRRGVEDALAGKPSDRRYARNPGQQPVMPA
jgi:hypothetical protein